MNEEWNKGLCREFVSAFSSILKHNRYGKNEYNFNQVGYDAIALYRELFEDSK